MTDQEEKTKRPASQYYWGDWFKDVALQACSLPARGLWHEMNCLMHQGEPYGYLTLPNGKPMSPIQLANLCKIGAGLCKKLVAELEDNGVLSRSANGAIFSRRMVRDEDLRNRRAAGGKEGSEHGVKGAESGVKGGRPKANKGGYETPLPGFEEPPPSSSSSSASSPSGLIPASNEALPAEPPPEPPEPPSCPTQRLLTAFGEVVPELPQPRRELWDGSAGADAMRQRWKWLLSAKRRDQSRYATTTDEGIDWFRRFFQSVNESDLLMGRIGKWRADLAWLMKKENFAKVVQGNYTNKEHA